MSRLLVVDDERAVRELIGKVAQRMGHEAVLLGNGKDAVKSLQGDPPDLMVVDLRIGDMDGLDLIRECRRWHTDMPIVMVTAHASVDTAVEAMRLGAYDYLTKPFEPEDLARTIESALACAGTNHAEGDAPSQDLQTVAPLVGSSESMRKLQLLIDRIARRPFPVVFEGEHGVGKMTIAAHLHRSGPSVDGPFRTLHCGAMPESLLELELAGGPGIRSSFERAAGGTLVFEEVDTLPIRIQAILGERLRDTTAPSPYRVVATTTRSLEPLVRAGEFRSDLFYALSVVPAIVPALRERAEDILPLAEYFLGKLQESIPGLPRQFDKEARKLLQRYPWPGNVGELQNAIQRACALGNGSDIGAVELPARIRQPQATAQSPANEETAPVFPVGTPLARFIRDQERRFIRATLESVGQNKEQAAGVLEVSLATLYRKLDG